MAVAGVVAFHAGFGWAVGGYLGVSAFFTLSGFLITSLLLAEHRSSGHVDLGAFWARRFRRLLPAALLTLVAVSVVGASLATPDQLYDLRADVLAALAYVANWRFLLEGRSYADLFAAPSPVLHFWSLAIEEQFYVLFPLLVFGVARVSRRPRRLLGIVLLALLAGSVVLGFVLLQPGGSTSTAYYATGTRAAELLVGALLAVVLGRPRQLASAAGRAVIGGAGVVALAGVVWSWTTVAVDTPGLYRGGLLAHAVATAVVIAATMQPGPVRAVLSLRPLRWLGRISYGAYLYHWPIFVWLTPARAHLRGLPLTAFQVALTLVLAAASLKLLEQPVRRGALSGWRPRVLAPVAAVAVVVAAVVATADPPKPDDDFTTTGLAAARASLAVDGEVAPPPPPEAPRVGVFGDSTALRTNFALAGWGIATGKVAVVAESTKPGCGLTRGGWLDYAGERRRTLPECDEWPDAWRWIVAANDLDATIIEVGPWDVTDRRLPGEDVWRHPGDPVYDAYLKQEMLTAVDVLSSSGARVLWLTSPRIELGRDAVPPPSEPFPGSDPARMDRLNQLVAEVAAERPQVTVIDLAAHLRSLPGGELDPRLRPDGVHFTAETSAELVEWLGPAVYEAATADPEPTPLREPVSRGGRGR